MKKEEAKQVMVNSLARGMDGDISDEMASSDTSEKRMMRRRDAAASGF